MGHTLRTELERRGHEVWFCDLMHHFHPNYIRCDIRNLRQLQRIFVDHDFDCVYHLAAEFGRHNGEDFYENLWSTNVIGTKNLLEQQRESRFRLVLFSSSEVYGDYNGVMSEDVLETHAIRQLNDYAMSKWVNEMQSVNSAILFNTETVRVRLFNVYGPGEYYSPYRSAICVFAYRALFGLPYTVFQGHNRTSLFIEDAVNTLGNIVEKFFPGRVYNIGGNYYHDMKTVSDIVLSHVGIDDKLVTYAATEPLTTRDKKVDVTRAMDDLGHEPRVCLEDGIARTIEWMKQAYNSPGVTLRNRNEGLV